MKEATEKKNPNHPQPGSSTTVEPIRRKEDRDAIAAMLASKPRDLLLFVLATNNGLRVGDLLKLKVSQVRNLRKGDSIQIRESKTGKQNILQINGKSFKALKGYLDTMKPADEDFLFPSRKGGTPLSIGSVNALVKTWTKAINLQGNFGAHSLRKSWGYAMRTNEGVGFELIAKRYNHGSPRTTMRYLGITDDEVVSILDHEV